MESEVTELKTLEPALASGLPKLVLAGFLSAGVAVSLWLWIIRERMEDFRSAAW